jgi:hypothetical protein
MLAGSLMMLGFMAFIFSLRGTPPVICVNAVDKGDSKRFGVNAADKGVTRNLRSENRNWHGKEA